MLLAEQLDRLARMEPVPYPVVSLYLNTQPNEHGRDQFQTFVRQEFRGRSTTYPAGSPDRVSLDADLARISTWLENELQPSANGVAIFACDAAGLFEAVQMAVPVDQQHPGVTRGRESRAQRRAVAAIGLVTHHTQLRHRAPERRQHGGGAVGAAVVDHDHLETRRDA